METEVAETLRFESEPQVDCEGDEDEYEAQRLREGYDRVFCHLWHRDLRVVCAQRYEKDEGSRFKDYVRKKSCLVAASEVVESVHHCEEAQEEGEDSETADSHTDRDNQGNYSCGYHYCKEHYAA